MVRLNKNLSRFATKCLTNFKATMIDNGHCYSPGGQPGGLGGYSCRAFTTLILWIVLGAGLRRRPYNNRDTTGPCRLTLNASGQQHLVLRADRFGILIGSPGKGL
jgi:hypothetical protein